MSVYWFKLMRSLYFHRHVGDLGNLKATDDGKCPIDIKDSRISLSGPKSIIGRTMVVSLQNSR